MRNWWYLVLFVLLLEACKKESYQESIDFGYTYQPFEVGYWAEYAVDSIVYDNNTSPVTIDTTHVFIRQYFESSFEDTEGAENLRVELYKKYAETDAWQLYEVGSINLTSSNYQTYFNDLRFVNLTFPVKASVHWDGLIFIDVDNEATLEYLDDSKYQWDFNYEVINEPYSIGSYSFDSTLTVIQIDEENLFERKYSREVYAKNIGMVEKEMVFLNTQLPPNGQSIEERAETGFIVHYTLINHP